MEVDDLLPLSGLQHVVFCERQAALIHVERIWMDNTATTHGNLVHERTDQPGHDSRRGIRVARSLPIISRRLRVFGIADLVELHEDPTAPRGVRPVPVEIKRGRRKQKLADAVQVCAQAICLEEMFELPIVTAWLSYATSHRRLEVVLDDPLRSTTISAALRLHELVASRTIPLPNVDQAVCATCSLEPICLPRATRAPSRSRQYLQQLAEEAK